ncbi:MAG: hypothetical protein NXH82_00155 [Rhodobacteraceae bacterium]|nr:hypothetical protein [Paracoccaceae bacterium]
MTGFIRPEARAALWRLREVLAGAATAALGALWVTGGGLLMWVGIPVIVIGVVLIVIGMQRMRFRIAGRGPGVVQIDEGQISYFGPLSGGVVAAAGIERLALDPSASPAHWVLDHDGDTLFIPLTAAGAEALFDVFSTLPGLRMERMLAEMKAPGRHPVVIWERRPLRPEGARLH